MSTGISNKRGYLKNTTRILICRDRDFSFFKYFLFTVYVLCNIHKVKYMVKVVQSAGGVSENPIFWPPDVKRWLIWKDPDAGKDWGLEEKGMTEDEMVGWHHWHNGHGFGWTLAVGDGQGGLACCGSWGLKESDMTEQLNWTELREQS